MKNEIYWNLELAIKPGKAEALTELAKEMTDRTKENEPGTLGYIWNVNADDSECHLFEKYADSNALMVHLGNFQEHFAGRFFELLDVKRWHVYGNASDQVKEAISPMGALFLEPVAGFTR